MILDKQVYKKIEYYLYAYENDHEQLEIAQEDIIYGVKTGYIDGGKSNQVSKVTEDRAIKLMAYEQKNKETKAWLEVIQIAKEKFKETEYEKVIQYTYENEYKLSKILRLMSMESSAYYERKNDIIMYIALKATEKGLLIH